MTKLGVRLLLIIFLFAILEMIVINIAGLLPLLAVHKENISDTPFISFVMGNFLHPFEVSTSMIEEKNPLFFIGSSAVIVFAIYVIFFMKGTKGKYELADRYGVHGSSKFAARHEIFKQGETIHVPAKQLMKDLEASMLHSKGEQ